MDSHFLDSEYIAQLNMTSIYTNILWVFPTCLLDPADEGVLKAIRRQSHNLNEYSSVGMHASLCITILYLLE